MDGLETFDRKYQNATTQYGSTWELLYSSNFKWITPKLFGRVSNGSGACSSCTMQCVTPNGYCESYVAYIGWEIISRHVLPSSWLYKGPMSHGDTFQRWVERANRHVRVLLRARNPFKRFINIDTCHNHIERMREYVKREKRKIKK